MKYLSALFLLSLLLACSPGDSTSAGDAPEKATAPESAPQPSDDEPLPFPVYTSFQQLEPLFHKNNDTTYVINFWATWCKPCVAELPYFEELNRKVQGEKVKVILVSLDFPRKLRSDLLPFLRNRNIQSEVIALIDGDYNAWIDKVNPEWGGEIPVTYIYREEKVKFHRGAFRNFEELEQAVREISIP